ncbi:serine/threonine-protein kinase [Caproiciproducens galactitolivorans]|uniref:serine/threonine-protein kinase n=1 Tax=Caproiciproducens galactitolivorans TaxID=642589 RepID=UPI002408F468|nr:serine/threonine-protein kinase [Caproiciproducens galactitolivorans]
MIVTEGTKLFDESNNSYIIDSVIGHGGFGIVYKAYRESDKKPFAIKTMLSSFESEQDYFSFKNEVKSAIEINSEYVINYEYVHDGNVFNKLPPYIIMEFANQGTLTNLFNVHVRKGEFFTNSELKEVFNQLAVGMLEINKKLVHRDIKMDNILLSNEKVKISDFGLSKFVNESTRTMTFKGYGSVLYVAPEAWKNEKNTIQMDIYSMGIVFYQLESVNTIALKYKI